MSKKARGTNFNNEEEMLLTEKVLKEKDVVECKTTNKVSVIDKEKAWIRITNNFNAKNYQLQNVDQLKIKYDNLKTRVRKEVAKQKAAFKGTGGGPSTSEILEPALEAILNIINVKTVVGLHNDKDDDHFYDNTLLTDTICTVEMTDDIQKDVPMPIPVVTNDSVEASVSHNTQEVIVVQAENVKKAEAAQTPKQATKWSHYVPQKLKTPIAKKLRSVINPVVTAKEEYYQIKNKMLKREEARKNIEHALNIKKMYLEIELLQNKLK